MLTGNSFLHSAYQFLKKPLAAIGKKRYVHSTAIMLGAGFTLTAAFQTGWFVGESRDALAAMTESTGYEEQTQSTWEMETDTEAKIQVGLTDMRIDGQLLVGGLLEKNVQIQSEMKAEAEIQRLERVRVRQAEEEQAAAEKAAAIAEAARQEAQAKEEAERRKKSMVYYTDADYNVLLRIVQAEAGICDEKGKILVANVILNRVRSSQFPGNITDVVYMKQQFSPVSDGSINRVKVTQETIDCVNRALAGEDYSQGALYFMYRGGSQKSNVSWFDSSLTYLFRHERHEFFK